MGQILTCANMNRNTSVTMNPGVLEVACCEVGSPYAESLDKVLHKDAGMSGTAVKVISGCGWCSAVETGK